MGGIGIGLVVSTFVFQIGKATGIPGFIFLSIGLALLIVYSVARKKQITPKD
jgi:ABC-type Fe3+-siderophore transport system permease subunit